MTDLDEVIDLLRKAARGENTPEDNTEFTSPDVQLLLSELIYAVQETDTGEEELEEAYSALEEYRKEAEEQLEYENVAGRTYSLFTLGCIYEVEADLASYLDREGKELYERAMEVYEEYVEENPDLARTSFTIHPGLHDFDRALRGEEMQNEQMDFEVRINRKIREYCTE